MELVLWKVKEDLKGKNTVPEQILNPCSVVSVRPLLLAIELVYEGRKILDLFLQRGERKVLLKFIDYIFTVKFPVYFESCEWGRGRLVGRIKLV